MLDEILDGYLGSDISRKVSTLTRREDLRERVRGTLDSRLQVMISAPGWISGVQRSLSSKTKNIPVLDPLIVVTHLESYSKL